MTWTSAIVAAVLLMSSSAKAVQEEAGANAATAGGLSWPPAANDCISLGFSSLLMCGDCTTMAEFVTDEELVADCNRCCAREAAAAVKFTKATIEVDVSMATLWWPDLARFLESKAKTIAGLTVRDRGGAPFLTLTRAGGEAERTSLVGWSGETIDAYLAERLEPLPAPLPAEKASKPGPSKLEAAKRGKGKTPARKPEMAASEL